MFNPSESGTGGRAPEAGARPEYHVWGLEPRAWRAREREPITGDWGGAPSGVQGHSLWSGGQGAKPP